MKLRKRSLAAAAVVALAALTAVTLAPANSATAQSKVSVPGKYEGYTTAQYDGHVMTSFYIPMRDGTRLAVDLFRPTKNGVAASEKLPVVWMHSPYNRRPRGGKSEVETYSGRMVHLIKYGYNVAVVDFRGLYGSFGENRANNAGQYLKPADTDAYDITGWFANQPWSSGKVGMWGCSATGGAAVQAMVDPHPALKAVMAMSPNFDGYSFGVYGGISPYGEEVVGTGHAASTREPNPNAARDKLASPVDGPDGEALLKQAIASHIDNADIVGRVPYRDSRASRLGGQQWWKVSSPSEHLDKLRRNGVGVYSIATWDEPINKPSTILLYKNRPQAVSKLLIGPEIHCRWDLVEDHTGFPILAEQRRFFDHWLKGVDTGVMKEDPVTFYTYNAPKGREWRTVKTWPLPQEVRTNFYLGAKTLASKAPSAVRDQTTVSPAWPARTWNLPVTGGLAYETPPFTADFEVTGHPMVKLWLSTPSTDVDVVARLSDIAPDGKMRTYHLFGRLRASGRALATAPFDNLGMPYHRFNEADFKPLTPNQPTELQFEMLPMSYVFPAGHKLRLELQFNDPQGRKDDRSPVTILTGGANASVLVLPVIPKR